MIGATEDDGLGERLILSNVCPEPVLRNHRVWDSTKQPFSLLSGKDELELVMFDATDVVDLKGMRKLFERTFGMARAEEALAHYLDDCWRNQEVAGSVAEGAATMEEEREAVDWALGQLGADLWYGGGSWHMANLVASAAAAPPVFLYSFAEPVYAGYVHQTHKCTHRHVVLTRA